MKTWKRAICAAAVVALAVGAAGCGEQQTGGSDTAKGEMPKELSIYANLGDHARRAGASDNNDLLAFQLMEELTGCHVTWTHPSGGSGTEKFNLLIASGNLPDVIVYNWQVVPGGAKMYADDEMIVPLQDMMETYMPNLTAFNQERPEIKKMYTDDNGSIYYIPFIRKDKELQVFLGPQIRQDWLDKLGLEVPTTTDELYNVLKAFKTGDPNGNGQADEIPMTGSTFESTAYGIGCLLWPFGTHYDFYVDGGQVKYGVLEDRFEEGIRYIAQLYSEGLIDIDFLINDRSKMDAKMMNDQAGFVYSFQPTLYATNMDDGVRKVTGIPHLRGPYGDNNCYQPDYGNSVTTVSAAITTANGNPEGTLKWLDAFFGEPGLEYMNFGREGETFEWVDGYPKLTDYILNNPDGKDKVSMCALNLGAYESQFPTLQDWRYYEQTLSDWGREAITTWASDVDASGVLPPLSFTEEETEENTQIMSQIDTYVLEAINKIIVGSEPVESLEKVRSDIKNMGIDRVLEIHNNAYQRYNSR